MIWKCGDRELIWVHFPQPWRHMDPRERRYLLGPVTTLEGVTMRSRYLIERKKRGTNDFYMVGVREAETIRDAAASVEPELMPGDQIRLSLLSVSLTATMTATREWEVAKLI